LEYRLELNPTAQTDGVLRHQYKTRRKDDRCKRKPKTVSPFAYPFQFVLPPKIIIVAHGRNLK
jgi:hypothetical protein